MMSWYYRILCQLILGKYRWIYLNDSRRKQFGGKTISFSQVNSSQGVGRIEWEMINKTSLQRVTSQRSKWWS